GLEPRGSEGRPPREVGRPAPYVAMRTADARAMRLLLRERLAPLCTLVGVGAILPTALLHCYGARGVMFRTNVHFVGVDVTALAAAVAALALTAAGVRRKDGRVVLVGTAFTVMAALLAIHGLATPGALIGPNGVIALTG